MVTQVGIGEIDRYAKECLVINQSLSFHVSLCLMFRPSFDFVGELLPHYFAPPPLVSATTKPPGQHRLPNADLMILSDNV